MITNLILGILIIITGVFAIWFISKPLIYWMDKDSLFRIVFIVDVGLIIGLSIFLCKY